MKKHLSIIGLTEISLRRRCGAQKDTSPHVLRTCEALVTFKHHYLVSFFLDPEDVRNLFLESNWVFIKGQTPMTWNSVPSGTK
jgi:hypothetical protein